MARRCIATSYLLGSTTNTLTVQWVEFLRRLGLRVFKVNSIDPAARRTDDTLPQARTDYKPLPSVAGQEYNTRLVA
jgi:hypothetical protein